MKKRKTNLERALAREARASAKLDLDRRGAQLVRIGLREEARASCALDGETQSCDLCLLEKTAGPHRCGRRDITEAERGVVKAARDLIAVAAHLRHRHPCEHALALAVAKLDQEDLRAARKGGKRG